MLEDIKKTMVTKLENMLKPAKEESNLSLEDKAVLKFYKADIIASWIKSNRDKIKEDLRPLFDGGTLNLAIKSVEKSGVKSLCEVITGNTIALSVEVRKGTERLNKDRLKAYLKVRKGWSDQQIDDMIVACSETSKPVETFKIVEI